MTQHQSNTTAVTGASGRLGGQVVQLLQTAGVDVVALRRRPPPHPGSATVRRADYADRQALRRALDGVDTLVLISSDGEGSLVLAHHLNILAAAQECGVGHVVALSGVDADVGSPFCYAITNGLTEQALLDSGCGFSIVRASLFTEFYAHFLLPARATGTLDLPTADGRVGLVSRSDVGRCLAALARSGPTGRRHDITGPVALDSDGVAALASRLWRRPVSFRPLSASEHAARLAAAGEEPWWVYAYTSMFASIREQRWDRVSDEVRRLTGREPRSVAEVLAAIPAV